MELWGSLPLRQAGSVDLVRLSAPDARAGSVGLRLVSLALRQAWMVDLPLVFLALLWARMVDSVLLSAPDARAYFFLLRQEKVAKKKATPGSAPGCAGFPALLKGPGGWLNSPSAQTTPADCPRPLCVARRGTWGPGKTSQRIGQSKSRNCLGRPEKKGKNQSPSAEQRSPNLNISWCVSPETPFRAPCEALSSAGKSGDFGSHCLRRRRVHASRPVSRAAQGTGLCPAPTQGCLFLWLLSFGQTKESTPARQARKPASNQQSTPVAKARKPALTQSSTPAAPARQATVNHQTTPTAKARIAAVKQRSTPARQARKPAAIEQTTPAAKARKPAANPPSTPRPIPSATSTVSATHKGN